MKGMKSGSINLLVSSGRMCPMCSSVLSEISFLEIISSFNSSDHYSIDMPSISDSILIYAGTMFVLKYSLFLTTAGWFIQIIKIPYIDVVLRLVNKDLVSMISAKMERSCEMIGLMNLGWASMSSFMLSKAVTPDY